MQSERPAPLTGSGVRLPWHRLLAHAAGLITLVWLALDYARAGDPFTFNRTFMLRTGAAALALLVASFACTPLSRLVGWPALTQVRRALGLYAFFYTLLHVWNYAVLENGLDLALVVRDLGERPAMSVGLLALLAWSRWLRRRRAAGSGAWAATGVRCIGWCMWPFRSRSATICCWSVTLLRCR